MTPQIIITLCVLAFLVIMLLAHRLPYGLTGMFCVGLLVLFRVTDLKTAMSGFSSSTTVMVATMIVVASQLSKTSIINRVRAAMSKLSGKSEIIVILAFFGATILLSQLMGQVACLSIMLLFCETLDEDSRLTPSRMLFSVCVLNTIWTSKIPIGMGATMPGTINAFFEGVAADYSIGITDYAKAALIPGLVGIIYCILFMKNLPTHKISKENVKEVKETVQMSQKHEIIVFAVFFVIMISFFLSGKIPSDVQNVLPLLGVCVFLITGVCSIPEVTKTITSDIVFLIASMSSISTILGATGVGELIGNTVLKILGGHPAPIFVITVFTLVTAVMTNFLSNMGTMALMIPIAASTALAGGFNVQTVVLVTACSAWMAYVMPTGCAGSMIAFGNGNYEVAETFKFTVPLFILELVSLIISTTLLFPVYA